MGSPNFQGLTLMAIIIGGLAVLVLVFIAIFVEFSEVLRTTSSDTLTLQTLQPNGSGTLIGTAGEFPFLQDVTGCVNNSAGALPLSRANYTVSEGNSGGGFLTLGSGASIWSGQIVNCTTVTFLGDSDGQAAADDFITGFTIFGTFTSIIVLAIMGLFIFTMFVTGRKGDE